MLNINQLYIDTKRTADLIEDFIKSSVYSSGLNGAVVAVSGGIDSATTLAATVKAIGPNKVFAITLPERDVTPNQDVTDVIQLCKFLGITCEQIEITPMLRGITDNLHLFQTQSKVAYGNIKARLRMLLTYYHANLLNSLVIGTSNKTELCLGYFTKFGDGGADILPLADLYKCQVRQIASFLKIPVSIVNKPASARLWVGQETENEIGCPYDILDLIVYAHIKGLTNSEIASEIGTELKIVESIVSRIKSSEHKRKPPLALRLS